jgi:hypothetical protein
LQQTEIAPIGEGILAKLIMEAGAACCLEISACRLSYLPKKAAMSLKCNIFIISELSYQREKLMPDKRRKPEPVIRLSPIKDQTYPIRWPESEQIQRNPIKDAGAKRKFYGDKRKVQRGQLTGSHASGSHN